MEINSNDKKYLKKLILLIITILFFILIFEISLRVLKPGYITKDNCYGNSEEIKVGLVENDARLGYSLKHNLEICQYDKNGNKMYFYTNDIRTRNKENFEEKPDYIKKRIIIIGDSMLTGFYTNQNESYAERLKHYLGDDYEIITTGAPGYATDRETLVFRDKISLGLKPDIVIMNIFPNDYVYDINFDGFIGWQDKFMLAAINKNKELQPIIFGNSPSSYINNFMKLEDNALEISTKQVENKVLVRTKPHTENLTEEDLEKIGIKKEVEKNSVFERLYSYMFIKEHLKKIFKKSAQKSQYDTIPTLAIMYGDASPELNNSILFNLKLFESIYKYGEAHNFTAIFINLPDRMQLDEKYFNEIWKDIIFPKNKTIDRTKINKIQFRFMQDKNYYYLDLLPDFKNAPEGIYYNEYNEHWNAKGNDIAAKIVAKYLKENNLV